jgi:hypothetical protein
MPNLRGKYWCFTLNNPTEDEISAISSLIPEDPPEDNLLAYIGFGREVGGNGTPHLQGYLELHSRGRLTTVRGLGGLGRAHFELRKGTATQAIEYCKKDSGPDNPYQEWGVVFQSAQGKRSDLDKVKELIDGGATPLQVADAHFGSFVRYHKGFDKYRSLRAPKTIRRVQVFCLWGAPGTGKTRYVFEREPELWISSDPTLQWFDGYEGQSAALLDDFRGDCKPSLLLRILDIYPTQVAIKGGFVPWVPERIYVTSNCAPPFGICSSFDGDGLHGAIMRRFTKIVELSENLDFRDEDAISNLLD